jgi:hypothetical protein
MWNEIKHPGIGLTIADLVSEPSFEELALFRDNH